MIFEGKRVDCGSELGKSILNRKMHPLYETTHLALVNNPQLNSRGIDVFVCLFYFLQKHPISTI